MQLHNLYSLRVFITWSTCKCIPIYISLHTIFVSPTHKNVFSLLLCLSLLHSRQMCVHRKSMCAYMHASNNLFFIHACLRKHKKINSIYIYLYVSVCVCVHMLIHYINIIIRVCIISLHICILYTQVHMYYNTFTYTNAFIYMHIHVINMHIHKYAICAFL